MSRPRQRLSTGVGRRHRCAIYTRVSTDHGLDQDFNSLDAQREACEAYIRSQTHEGWELVRDRFDDGGFSGGSLERPALTRLLAQMELGRVDTIVVYKVDRLTRSLADFAKLVERFDERGASFVSITQSFNSTSSMGRLTLNMLLSFAQFEREVTGERIRDKIAASKRKGIWVGGNPPFGYVVQDRKLVIKPSEAEVVRRIFARYIALGSLGELLAELRAQNIRTRARTLSSGKTRGGCLFGRGALAALLKNRTYLGELNHHGQSFAGEHPAIIDIATFERVQATLAEGTHAQRSRQHTSDFLLKGLLYDDRGFRMSPVASKRGARRHRYYVSRALVEGAKNQAGSVARVSAPALEAAVMAALKQASPTRADRSNSAPPGRSGTDPIAQTLIQSCCSRIIVGREAITIDLLPDAADRLGRAQLTVSWSPRSTRVTREVLGAGDHGVRPMRADQRSTMLLAIAKGRAWLDELLDGSIESIDELAEREHRTVRSIGMGLSLAFLAPDVIQAAVDGVLPRGISLSRLFDLPSDWAQQKAALGLASTPSSLS